MGWSIQEIRITEGDVLGSRSHQTPNVLQDDLLRDGEKPAAVDRWNGAMQAVVLTAAAGFDIADRAADAITLQLSVLLQGREPTAIGHAKIEMPEEGSRDLSGLTDAFDRAVKASVKGLDEGDKRPFKLPADDRIDPTCE